MDIRTMSLERVPNTDEVLTINRSGLYWSAHFMRQQNLQKAQAVEFLLDNDSPYWFGFRFYEETGKPDTLMLCQSGRGKGDSAGRTVKALEIYGKKKILNSIAKNSSKHQRKFLISWDKVNKTYFVILRPSFEHSVKISHISEIPIDAKGIYRYIDDGEIVYIGQGDIRGRVGCKERDEWKADTIEFSCIADKEACIRWESVYLDEFIDQFGRRPRYNKVSGHHPT